MPRPPSRVVKLSQSYHRRMDFQARAQADAARVFDGLLRGSYAGLESSEGRLLEDYLVFECCRAASAMDLTIQFHLGMRAGNNGSLEGADPTPMIELFRGGRFLEDADELVLRGRAANGVELGEVRGRVVPGIPRNG